MIATSERFDDLSSADAKALLRELAGPLLEIILNLESGEDDPLDVLLEVMHSLSANPRVSRIFPTDEEQAEWERYRLEHGDGPEEIGRFVYGPDANPWAPKASKPQTFEQP